MIKKYWLHIVLVIVVIFLILLFVDFSAWNNFLKKEKNSQESQNSDSVNNWVNTIVSSGPPPEESLFVYPRAGNEVAVLDKTTRKQIFKTKYMVGKFLRKTEDGKYYEVLWDEAFPAALVYGASVYVTKKK